MARVLLAWEFGGDLGHVRRLVPIARELRAMGHDVVLAFRDLAPLGRELPGDLEWFQAPWLVPPARPDPSPLNASQILLNLGFADPSGLGQALRAWTCTLRVWGIEAVVADAAPTAQLAAGALGLARATLGSGFSVPRFGDPMPAMRPWIPTPEERLREIDAQLVAAVKKAFAAARIERPAPSRAADVFTADAHFVCAFPALDPFEAREGVEYLGRQRGDMAYGLRVAWEGSARPRILAYLKPRDARFRLLVEALGRLGGEAIVAAPGLESTQAQALSAGSLRVFSEPLELGGLLASADLALGHGGAGFTAQALEAAVPMGLLPMHLEQHLIARRAKALGAAELSGPDEATPADPAAWLGALAASPTLRDGARKAAASFGAPVSAAQRLGQWLQT